MMRKQNKGSDFLPHANSEKFGAVNHSDVTNLSLRARQDKLLPTAEYYRCGWFCRGNLAETRWTKNPSRWELEWGIIKIRGGLKNQPHRFRGDFEKQPELYCKC